MIVQHRHLPLPSGDFLSLGLTIYSFGQMLISFGRWYPFLLFYPFNRDGQVKTYYRGNVMVFGLINIGNRPLLSQGFSIFGNHMKYCPR